MHGIDKYLLQQSWPQGQKPWYNILQWEESAVRAGVNSIIIPYQDAFNTLFIEIYQMSMSIDGLGGNISFKDARLNTNLFTVINNTPSWNVQTFNYLVNDSQFEMICSDINTKFAVSYCRITNKPEIK